MSYSEWWIDQDDGWEHPGVTCDRCGALVPTDLTERHDAFHDDLDIRVLL